MLKASNFKTSDLVKVGDAFDWPAVPGHGAEVELNSGGPRMLIVDCDGETRLCEWRDGDDLHRHAFSYRMLKPFGAA